MGRDGLVRQTNGRVLLVFLSMLRVLFIVELSCMNLTLCIVTVVLTTDTKYCLFTWRR